MPVQDVGHDVRRHLCGGVRMPIKGDIYALNVEGRFCSGNGNTGGIDEAFLATRSI
jgi:hypothetical protein